MCKPAVGQVGILANFLLHPVIPHASFCVITSGTKNQSHTVEISDSLQEVIVSYFEGKLTQAQADELLDWVRQDDNNLLYFRQMGELWHASGYLQQPELDETRALEAIKGRITERGIRNLPGREIRFRLSSLFKVAAAMLAIVALGITGMLIFHKSQSAVTTSLFVETSAPRGSRSMITLPDGTTVWLNADTKFRYPVDYGTTNRTVFLEGEAYFKVSRNKKLPFKVHTSDITVTALGTAFNVKAYKEEGTIETTLEEGRVRIEGMKATGQAGQVKPVVLKPRQSAVFQKSAGDIAVNDQDRPASHVEPSATKELKILPIQVNDVTDTRLYTSWKDTRWIFKNERLASLVPKLERRYDVKIEFIDKELEDYAFNGILLEESLEQVLAVIRLTAPIRYEVNAKEVKLYVDKNLLEQYRNILNP
jgi:transmembrane sensor